MVDQVVDGCGFKTGIEDKNNETNLAFRENPSVFPSLKIQSDVYEHNLTANKDDGNQK